MCDLGAGENLKALIVPRLMGILATFGMTQLGRFTEESYLVMRSVSELLQLVQCGGRWKNKFLSILRLEKQVVINFEVRVVEQLMVCTL